MSVDADSQALERIREKLDLLRVLDAGLAVFGSSAHRYQMSSKHNVEQLEAFEVDHGISLPPGYRRFLLEIGNGGAGPFYGLEPVENGRFVDLDKPVLNDLIDLSKPFPHTDLWNPLEGDESSAFDDDTYFDNDWAAGALRISNFGCGVWILLVVNGTEYGNIWFDDRASDNGIYPDQSSVSRIPFLKWYESWLDESLWEARGAT